MEKFDAKVGAIRMLQKIEPQSHGEKIDKFDKDADIAMRPPAVGG